MPFAMLKAILVLLPLSAGFVNGDAGHFRPSQYPKSTARCWATKRAPKAEIVRLDLKYVDINPKASTTLVMVHGWPSLWSTWSKQIQEFQDDYHLVVPDLRGFGESAHPGDVRSSGTLGDIVDDLVCILNHAKVNSAICMGHDWGSAICYEAARLRPDIFKAMIGAVVPYIPADGHFKPIKEFTPIYPTLNYQLFFDKKTDLAAGELDRDIRRTIRATLRTVDSPPPESFLKSDDSFLAAWDSIEIPPVPFFTQEEEDYFVEQYSVNGFRNTLHFYTTDNRLLDWKFARDQGNHTISQPVLAIFPLEDPVANWVSVSNMLKSSEYLPNLRTELLMGAHWVHLENPEEFNRVTRQWLDSLPSHVKAGTNVP